MKTGAKILIVDDDAIASFIIKRNLVKNGFDDLFLADNAKDAVQLFSENKANLAIIDLNLGNESGIMLAQRLQQIDPQLTIIFLSASIDPAQIAEARRIPNATYFDRFVAFEEIVLFLNQIYVH